MLARTGCSTTRARGSAPERRAMQRARGAKQGKGCGRSARSHWCEATNRPGWPRVSVASSAGNSV